MRRQKEAYSRAGEGLELTLVLRKKNGAVAPWGPGGSSEVSKLR